jgi:hypothetical protein
MKNVPNLRKKFTIIKIKNHPVFKLLARIV